tara:strand:+ start:397 stop:882 length:486 start_codon:yes stop_codon:yes gene_type:complete
MGLKLAGVMMVLMLAMGGLGYWYYNDSQEKMRILHENNAKLETAAKIQTEAIKSLEADVELASSIAAQTTKQLQDTQKAVEDMRGKFNKQSKLLGSRDLGKMAVSKAKPIRRIVNKGTSNMFRCFEIVSGQQLTEKEQNAEKPSQLNNMCPSIANPNRVQQ